MQLVVGWALFGAAIAIISVVAGREKKQLKKQEEELRKSRPSRAA